jgi:hypothetical protein
MTPDQAIRAASVLQCHAPSDPEGYAAALAGVEFLRRHAAAPARWSFDPDTRVLLAGEPGGTSRLIPNVSDFALDAALAWRAYPEPADLVGSVEFTDADHEVLKSRRWGLAERLKKLRMFDLAQAVRDVRLLTRGDQVLALYSPAGVPLRIDFK